jgi:DNA-binding MarR family transcriptional regulator
MNQKNPPGMDPYQFILENIDSVPHLEALMLLWNSRPVGWTLEELASRLYVPMQKVEELLNELVRLSLIARTQTIPAKHAYSSRSTEQDEMMEQVDSLYRKDLVRISTMIHSKASSPVREFARAFRFKKERD